MYNFLKNKGSSTRFYYFQEIIENLKNERHQIWVYKKKKNISWMIHIYLLQIIILLKKITHILCDIVM